MRSADFFLQFRPDRHLFGQKLDLQDLFMKIEEEKKNEKNWGKKMEKKTTKKRS